MIIVNYSMKLKGVNFGRYLNRFHWGQVLRSRTNTRAMEESIFACLAMELQTKGRTLRCVIFSFQGILENLENNLCCLLGVQYGKNHEPSGYLHLREQWLRNGNIS